MFALMKKLPLLLFDKVGTSCFAVLGNRLPAHLGLLLEGADLELIGDAHTCRPAAAGMNGWPRRAGAIARTIWLDGLTAA